MEFNQAFLIIIALSGVLAMAAGLISKNRLSPEAMGYTPLSEITRFPNGQYRQAIAAIVAELNNSQENPEEFYAKPLEDTTATKLSFEIIHKDSFTLGIFATPGNPSGKNRKAVYDVVTKKLSLLLTK